MVYEWCANIVRSFCLDNKQFSSFDGREFGAKKKKWTSDECVCIRERSVFWLETLLRKVLMLWGEESWDCVTNWMFGKSATSSVVKFDSKLNSFSIKNRVNSIMKINSLLIQQILEKCASSQALSLGFTKARNYPLQPENIKNFAKASTRQTTANDWAAMRGKWNANNSAFWWAFGRVRLMVECLDGNFRTCFH